MKGKEVRVLFFSLKESCHCCGIFVSTRASELEDGRARTLYGSRSFCTSAVQQFFLLCDFLLGGQHRAWEEKGEEAFGARAAGRCHSC